MTEYKCPYCGNDKLYNNKSGKKQFTNWKSVRAHTSTCKNFDGMFYIDLNLGPIHYDNIKGLSVRQLRNKYPNLKATLTNLVAGFQKRFEVPSLISDTISNDDLLLIIKKFHQENQRIPLYREFKVDLGKYPDPALYSKRFGSWNEAIELAGFAANYNDGWGIRTVAKDDVLYRSSHEAYFVNNFLYGKYTYQYEIPYGNGWKYDFYIKELNLYIELDGGLRPQRIEEKRKYHLTHGINCLIIKTEDIYKKDFKICRVS